MPPDVAAFYCLPREKGNKRLRLGRNTCIPFWDGACTAPAAWVSGTGAAASCCTIGNGNLIRVKGSMGHRKSLPRMTIHPAPNRKTCCHVFVKAQAVTDTQSVANEFRPTPLASSRHIHTPCRAPCRLRPTAACTLTPAERALHFPT